MRYNLPNGIRIYLCVSSRLERTPTIKLTVTLPRFHHESPIYLLYCRHHTNLFILTLQFPRFQLFSDPNLGPTDRDWHALFYCWNELFIVWINNKCSFTVQLLNRSLQAHFQVYSLSPPRVLLLEWHWTTPSSPEWSYYGHSGLWEGPVPAEL